MGCVESLCHTRKDCNFASAKRSLLGTELLAANIPRQVDSVAGCKFRQKGWPFRVGRPPFKHDRR